MHEDSDKNFRLKDSKLRDKLYTNNTLRPATGMGNGIIASMLILLPLIAFVIWL